MPLTSANVSRSQLVALRRRRRRSTAARANGLRSLFIISVYYLFRQILLSVTAALVNRVMTRAFARRILSDYTPARHLAVVDRNSPLAALLDFCEAKTTKNSAFPCRIFLQQIAYIFLFYA